MNAGSSESIDRDWLQRQVKRYSAEQRRYRLYATWLQAVLKDAAGGICATPIVQTRAKGVASFAGKCVRRWPKVRSPAEEFTDLCGGRIIVQLLSEVEEAARWIRRHFRIDEANSSDKRAELRPHEFGYLSVHLIVQVDPYRLPDHLLTDEVVGRNPDGEVLRAVEPAQGDERPPLTKRDLTRLCNRIGRDGPQLTREMWDQLAGLKAEVQLRTMAQHAWSDVGHDLLYKSAFEVPADYERRSAKIAALLEEVDEAFTELADGVRQLQTNVGAYHDRAETHREIERRQAILQYDRGNAAIAAETARLQISIGEYAAAIETAEKHYPGESGCDIPLDVCIGRARCLQGRNAPMSEDLHDGRALLECVLRQQPGSIEAATYLADSYASSGEFGRALDCFATAFRIDPQDPAALAGYLRHRMADDRNPFFAAVLRPNIEAAIRRCRDQVDVRVNLPFALYRMAEFHLLLCVPDSEPPDAAAPPSTPSPARNSRNAERHTYEGLYALCRAVALTTDPVVLGEELDKFSLLAGRVLPCPPGLRWARLTLELAYAFHPQTQGAGVDLPKSETNIAPDDPVLILAGGCDEREALGIDQHRDVLEAVLDEFARSVGEGRKGIVLCGGTTQGISGEAARIVEELDRADRLRLIGYLPELLPASATPDPDHYELFQTSGNGFSALEVLQSWRDLLAGGVPARRVKLVGVNGGRIAAFEYHLAAALAAVNAVGSDRDDDAEGGLAPFAGGQVAVVRKSGRAADELMLAEDAPGNEYIRFLPADPETYRAFVNYVPSEPGGFMPDELDRVKTACGEAYRETLKELRDAEREKAIDADEKLRQAFDRSTLEQAMHIHAKLRRIGKRAVRVESGRPEVRPLTDDEVAILAEMEHGRWVAERTLRGWRLGPKADDEKRIRPQLVAWDELPADEKEKDLAHARAIPGILASVGWEIRELADASEPS